MFPLALRHRQALRLAFLSSPLTILFVGCPHRSPVWSPDSKHILLLARSSDEAVDKPAGAVWLVDAGSRGIQRLKDPLPGARYLAAAWIDEQDFVVFTALMADGEVKEGSEAIWRGRVGGGDWVKVPGPAPSAERTPRRLPLVVSAKEGKALVYSTGNESVAVVGASDGKVLLKLEPGELVGPGPGDGFLIIRPEGETGGLELVAIGPELKPLWTKRFSELAKEISAQTGKKPSEIVINDTSTSARLGTPSGSEAAVVFVYTDVSWREGISGYYVRFDGKDGKVLAAASATALPGRPGEAAGLAWAITPSAERGSDTAVIRSFTIGKDGETSRMELPGLKKGSIYGYSLSPDGKGFAAVVGGQTVKLLLYPIEGRKIAAKPIEIELGA